MWPLLVLAQVAVARAEEHKSRGTKSLCVLPSKNMSLAPLGENDFYVAENRDDRTVIYLSLCHPLRLGLCICGCKLSKCDHVRNLPLSVVDLCDPGAFACITKVNETTREETEHQRNAGRGTGAPKLSGDGGHLQLIFEDGGECQDNNYKKTGYATWIAFFCSSDFAADNAIRYEGKFGNCASQVMLLRVFV